MQSIRRAVVAAATVLLALATWSLGIQGPRILINSINSVLRSTVMLLLGLTLIGHAQELPQDATLVPLDDALSWTGGALWRLSSYVPGDSPPLPPAILQWAADQGLVGPTNVFYSATLGGLLWDDREVTVLQMAAEQAMSGNLRNFQVQEQQQDLGSQGPYGTSDFYLEPVSITNGLFNLILHGTTNASTYLITSTEFLDPTTTSVWLAEGSLQGGTNDSTAFALGIALRTNSVFVRAQPCDECATNALPLDWQLAYFGVTGIDPNADYDSDGVSNLDEYLGGTDPNKLVVYPRFGNFYINDTTAYGTFTIYRGVPSQMAILVNTNDFSTAQWQPYTAEFSVPLGPTDGVYRVWIGVRGLSAGSRQTWNETDLTRDLHAPDIGITSPTNNVTAQPMIDVRGYSPERLLNLYYDVINDAGTIANVQALITDQYLDPNTFEFTTNWFLCPDIELTNGVNTITLRATDLAGNVSTNVFTYTLDLSVGTNPPVLALYWPQDGEVVCGSDFTVRGRLDDPTAAVSAQIVDGLGNAGSVKAVVERNGLLWVEGLPLAPGTNTVTLTMTNATGYWSMTNFTVIHSDDVNLTIDDVPAEQLATGIVSVTGTIDSGDYTVWVNGVVANTMVDMGDGTWWWQADGVVVGNGGTATIQAVAIPNSENENERSSIQAPDGDSMLPNTVNGGGAGREAEALAGAAASSNPQAPGQRGKEINPEQQAGVYTKEYHFNYDETWDMENVNAEWQISHYTLNQDYTNSQGLDPVPIPASGLLVRATYEGQDRNAFDWGEGFWTDSWRQKEFDYVMIDPATKVTKPMSCIIYTNLTQHAGSAYWTTVQVPPPPYKMWEEDTAYDLGGAGSWVTGERHRTERVQVKLRTGGKRLSKRQNLFHLSGWATNYTSILTVGWRVYAEPVDSTWATEAVSPGGIKVLGKPLNGTDMAFPNGMTYKALPDNEEHDITPVVNAQRYTFGIGAAKHELRLAHYCLLAGDTNRTDLGVGERVDLSFSAALVNNSAWTCTWSTAAGSVYPSSGNATTFIAPSNASPATVTATVGDEQVDVPFAVFEPSGIKASLRGLPDLFAIGSVGAGMYMNVVLQPTNVSFYRVQVKEPVADATNKQGYFVNHPPPNHDELHGAGAWHPVLCNNFVSDGVFDHADSYNWPIGQSGVYTWPIDAIWRIAADSVTHALSGWTPQVHTLSADGTVTVEKLGHHVTRSPNQPYGTAQ